VVTRDSTQRLPKERKITVIMDAISKVKLTEHEAWKDLEGLSSHTTIDGINVDPAGVMVTGNKFIGLAAVYVALKYDSDAGGGLETSTSDTFEGQFEGHFEGTQAVIDRVTVDTSPFYE
jgi:hypothetical protein